MQARSRRDLFKRFGLVVCCRLVVELCGRLVVALRCRLVVTLCMGARGRTREASASPCTHLPLVHTFLWSNPSSGPHLPRSTPSYGPPDAFTARCPQFLCLWPSLPDALSACACGPHCPMPSVPVPVAITARCTQCLCLWPSLPDALSDCACGHHCPMPSVPVVNLSALLSLQSSLHLVCKPSLHLVCNPHSIQFEILTLSGVHLHSIRSAILTPFGLQPSLHLVCNPRSIRSAILTPSGLQSSIH
eukprot:360883-Chlamydomonas_euryale.AAC.4